MLMLKPLVIVQLPDLVDGCDLRGYNLRALGSQVKSRQEGRIHRMSLPGGRAVAIKRSEPRKEPMSKATTGVRTRNLYDPRSSTPFRLSRSKLEDFTNCPCCFYLDRRLGVGRPDMPGWPINSAIDELLKREFDAYRERREPHPIMRKYGIDAIPLAHPDLDEWRRNFGGITHHHADTDLILTGAVDDIWQDSEGRLIVVDYKATSTQSEITLEAEYRQGYKRQLEIYQWLLRQNGFDVSNRAYIVYANGLKDRPSFDGRMDFDMTVLPHDGDASWVETCVREAHACLQADTPPPPGDACSFCLYRNAAVNAGL